MNCLRFKKLRVFYRLHKVLRVRQVLRRLTLEKLPHLLLRDEVTPADFDRLEALRAHQLIGCVLTDA